MILNAVLSVVEKTHWDVPQGVRDEIVDRLGDALHEGDTRQQISAIKVAIDMVGANQRQFLESLRATGQWPTRKRRAI